MELFLPLMLPALIMGLFELPSLAIGLTAIALSHIIRRRNIQLPPVSMRVLIVLITMAIPGLAGGAILYGEFDGKQIFSFIALTLVFFAGFSYAHRVLNYSIARFRRSAVVAYCCMLAIGIAGLLGLVKPGYYAILAYPVFPFMEPSHFALAFSVISCLLLTLTEGISRYVLVLISFGLSVAFPNLTLFAGSMLQALLLVNRPRYLMLVIGMFIPIIIYVLQNPELYDYFNDRIFDDQSENLSRMVYSQGWESIGIALEESYGAGIGFQNLGKQAIGTVTAQMDRLFEGSLNRQDGGFMFAKIVSEFGLVGAIFCSYLAYLSLQSGLKLISHMKQPIIDDNSYMWVVVPACLNYIFLIELFVRGVGYFSATFIATISFTVASRILLQEQPQVLSQSERVIR